MASTLNLYRAALELRTATPGFIWGTMRWLDGPPHTLVLGRDHGIVCAVNLGDQPATLPPPADILCASSPVHRGPTGELVLPPDTAAW